LDLDGDLDMVVANRDQIPEFADYNDFNFVLRNRGSPATGGGIGVFDIFRFTSSQDLDTDSTHDAALGDYDQDGDLDLVIANDIEPNKLWRNKAAQIPNPAAVTNPAAELFEHVALGGVESTSDSHHCAFVDLNGDGWLDIHMGGDDFPNSGIYWNNGNSTFNYVETALVPIFPMYSAAYGDLNGDDQLDIVTVGFGMARVFLNCREGPSTTFRWSSGVITAGGVWNSPLGVAIGDLDQDMDLDIVVSQGDAGNLVPNRIFLNNRIPPVQ